MSSQDIAVYGALCALASFDRRDLKTKVLQAKFGLVLFFFVIFFLFFIIWN